MGCKTVDGGWVSCCWHDGRALFLIIYVNDFMLSGPVRNLQKGWALLRKGLVIEPESRIGNKSVGVPWM